MGINSSEYLMPKISLIMHIRQSCPSMASYSKDDIAGLFYSLEMALSVSPSLLLYTHSQGNAREFARQPFANSATYDVDLNPLHLFYLKSVMELAFSHAALKQLTM